MKIALTIKIDDKDTAFESITHLQPMADGKVDPVTMQWILYGMLTDAIQRFRVVAPPPEVASPELSVVPNADGALQ